MQFDVLILEPAEEFLQSLDRKLRAKAIRSIGLLQEFGPRLQMPHARKLVGHDLYELRVKLGSNICRLFYFYADGQIYVVTSGYSKKSDRTSRQEIIKAIRLRSQFEEKQQ